MNEAHYEDEAHYDVVLPDLGLDDVTVSAWLAPVGQQLIEGGRLLEVLAGDVTVDLPAPVSGRLIERRVREDDRIHTGQVLAVLARQASPD